MTDEPKKPKIDLKSRLGTRVPQQAAQPGAPVIPPPVGIPKPAIPGAAAPRRAGPRVDASDPYASIGQDDIPRPKVEQQAIKVEMSAEVMQAQKRGRVLTGVLVLVGALVGGLLGFAFGDRSRSQQDAFLAREGARELVVEVEKATTSVNELAEVLKSAMGNLRDNKYPDAEVKKLGEINIPFDGGTLAGRGMGRFNAKLQALLIQFSSRCQEANDTKEKLQLTLSYSKKQLADVLVQQNEATRQVQWGVYIVPGKHGPWAVMQPLDQKQWFLVTKEPEKKPGEEKPVPYTWPAEIKITDGGKEVPLKRYESGDPSGSSPKIIPVDPTTQSAVAPTTVTGVLSREMNRLEVVLKGDQTPGQEKQGLFELAEIVLEELKKIAQG